MNPAIEIRPAGLPDVDAITEIYNEAILTTTATFDVERKTRAERPDRFRSHGEERRKGTGAYSESNPSISFPWPFSWAFRPRTS